MNTSKLTLLQINDTHGSLEPRPELQMGGYVKRSLGLTLYVKVENPAGSRMQQCFVGTEELRRDQTYTEVFVTTQGVPKNMVTTAVICRFTPSTPSITTATPTRT